jgi:DNA replication and repair protein RecF
MCIRDRVRGDKLEIFVSRSPRLILKAKINGVAKKAADFIGHLPAVVFSPETIDIISGSPGERRKFLDIMISQIDKEYLISLMNFKKIRQQRNSLLQKIREGLGATNELEFWNGEFVRESKTISTKREEAIKFINDNLPAIYKEISGKETDCVKVEYIKNYEGDLRGKLAQSLNRDIAYGGTIYGPHRDNLEFKLNGRDMANFASRGEAKSAILALKVTELNFIEKAIKNRRNFDEEISEPVLLLDDIFSEFDADRRAHLAKIIERYQSIITTTDKEHLSADLLETAKIIEL